MNLTQLKQRRAEAKALKRELDNATKAQEEHVAKWEKSTLAHKNLTPQRRAQLDEAFARRDQKLDQRENSAYAAYYKHMHEDFDINHNRIKFTSGKYKEHFCDIKYIDDLYDQKEKQIRRQQQKNKKGAKSHAKASRG